MNTIVINEKYLKLGILLGLIKAINNPRFVSYLCPKCDNTRFELVASDVYKCTKCGEILLIEV